MASKKRRRHTPDQIIRKLAEGNNLLASGQELGGGQAGLNTGWLWRETAAAASAAPLARSS